MSINKSTHHLKMLPFLLKNTSRIALQVHGENTPTDQLFPLKETGTLFWREAMQYTTVDRLKGVLHCFYGVNQSNT